MTWLWTWGGTSFGYRKGDDLFTHDGKHVGRFHGDDIHGRNGRYIGELRGGNRLITQRSGKNVLRGSFAPTLGGSYVKQVNYVGNVMLVGYEDFPGPESFQ